MSKDLSLNITLTEFVHSAEVDLLSFTAIQVEVKQRAREGKPPYFGFL